MAEPLELIVLASHFTPRSASIEKATHAWTKLLKEFRGPRTGTLVQVMMLHGDQAAVSRALDDGWPFPTSLKRPLLCVSALHDTHPAVHWVDLCAETVLAEYPSESEPKAPDRIVGCML